jgi:isoquinoline 1-oxidoreductase subunit beta
MEPLNGTALVTADRVEAWHSSQDPDQSFWVIAHETGLHPSKIRFHQTHVGSAFGRRSYSEDLRMVVAVARKFPGRPVHVIWSREEMTRQGRSSHSHIQTPCRPREGWFARCIVSALRLACMAFFHTEVVSPGRSDRYALPSALHQELQSRVRSHENARHDRRVSWPGLQLSSVFFTETFIDECAHAAAMDPYLYRLKLLEGWPDPGWAKCLTEAATQSGWRDPLPKGFGRGIAIGSWRGEGKPQTGTTLCTVATIEVSKAGHIVVHQIDVAFDTGGVLNADSVRAQMEGGTLFGMNVAINEEINIRDGRVVEGNFDQYQLMRIGDVPPKLNIHFGGLTYHKRFAQAGAPPAARIGSPSTRLQSSAG